ncbi:hypothetical protein [[Mycoplasma] falconis]|nr:hypothetical protein [[Mycoplasma] falconis]
MKSHKTRKQKAIGGLLWTGLSLAIVGSVSGALYFMVKNSRKVNKEHWSAEKFLKHAEEIKLDSPIITPSSAKNIYNSLEQEIKAANDKIRKYIENNPEIEPYIDRTAIDGIQLTILNTAGEKMIKRSIFESADDGENDDKNNTNSKKHLRKLLENIPPKYDVNAYISQRIQIKSNFENNKFLVIRFTGFDKTEDIKVLKVNYIITLNHDYAASDLQIGIDPDSPKSKYYFKGSQEVKFLTSGEKISYGSEFDIHSVEIIKQARKIINSGITDDPAETEEWFKSEKFAEEIFAWFVDNLKKYDAFPDIYPEDKFKIIPYLNNGRYVIWNPNKGLDSLTITYQYQNKENPDSVSRGLMKIFTVGE